MAKRIMLVVVGAALGSILGMIVSFVAGGYPAALFMGAALGAVIPVVVLGTPGR